MNYDEFKAYIITNQLSKSEYWQNIIKHKESIFKDIYNTSQAKVATDLKMSQPKLSIVVNLLKALEC